MNIDTIRYPVDAVMPELVRAFGTSNTVVLSAPTGAGKTTRVPIAMMKEGIPKGAKILMLEPRRLAARRAAEFMSAQLNEQTGNTVGYRTRGDTKTSPTTTIEILTEGILTRMLQHEPDLPGVGLVIFDEFHERSIHADLALAFSLDVQKHVRDDLHILIMSATLDGARLTEFLGNVPLVESKGKLFSVEVVYSKFSSERAIEVRIADAVERALDNHEGDILVFLPGWREIQRTEQALYDRHRSDEVVVHTLHGEAPFVSQSAALSPAPLGKRKVILSTNIAETSLTIEGVRIVIDSGLVRTARFDPRRGMSGLFTVPVSRASADQRKGRAGRLANGVCYRLWTEAEHVQLAEFSQPEIKSADLAPLALELAQWGTPNGENLLFLDPPPPANLRQAQGLLRGLEAVDERGKLTVAGRSLADIPVHPRLAQMIVRAKSLGFGAMACEVAALLEERDLFAGRKNTDVDLSTRWRDMRSAKGSVREHILAQAERLMKLANVTQIGEDESKLGLLLAFAYPDRIAQRRSKDGREYVATSGTTASLPAGSLMSRNEFIVIADADNTGTTARIFLCAALTRQDLVDTFGPRIVHDDEIRWNPAEESVLARHVTRLGAIILSEKAIAGNDERISSAMMEGIRSMGLQSLPWDKESLSLQSRNAWVRAHRLVEEDWPDLSNQRLLESLESWLKPFLDGIRQRAQLGKLDLPMILKSHLSHQRLQTLERLAPPRLRLPSGSWAAIDYGSGEVPVLAVRLQELFGQTETPRVGRGQILVLIHLLSPARRPLAVTQDLPSFWKKTYPEIRSQLRAKYPKHLWPEDPIAAKPTNKTKRQLKRGR